MSRETLLRANRWRGTPWVVAIAIGAVLWGACRGSSSVPEDLEPAESKTPEESLSGVSELLWGGWHSVPWDPAVKSVLEPAYRLQLQGKSVDAIAVLNDGLSSAPECPSLLDARGALYAALGYRRAAQRDFEETLELDPDRPGTWTALARMRQELGLGNAALEALREAEHRGAEGVELHLIWARALRQLGRRGQAADRYEAALESTRRPPFELLVEAASLFEEGGNVPPELVDQALRGVELPEDRHRQEEVWLVRDLMCELAGMEPERVASGLVALDVAPESLALWSEIALRSVRLQDPETRTEVEGRAMALGDSREP